MNAYTVTTLAMQALTVTLEVSMPFLLTGLAVGLAISVTQGRTSIQDPALTLIPKIIATGAVLAVGGPWMLDQMLVYVHNLYVSIPSMVGP